jgi:molecular chaperone GrpE (heat shock protein)
MPGGGTTVRSRAAMPPATGVVSADSMAQSRKTAEKFKFEGVGQGKKQEASAQEAVKALATKNQQAEQKNAELTQKVAGLEQKVNQLSASLGKQLQDFSGQVSDQFSKAMQEAVSKMQETLATNKKQTDRQVLLLQQQMMERFSALESKANGSDELEGLAKGVKQNGADLANLSESLQGLQGSLAGLPSRGSYVGARPRRVVPEDSESSGVSHVQKKPDDSAIDSIVSRKPSPSSESTKSKDSSKSGPSDEDMAKILKLLSASKDT